MHFSHLNSLSSWSLPEDVSHVLFSGDIHGTTVSYGVGLFANISKAVVSPGKSLRLALFACCCDYVQIPVYCRLLYMLRVVTWDLDFSIHHCCQVQWHCGLTATLDRHWDALKNEGSQAQCKLLLLMSMKGLRRERQKGSRKIDYRQKKDLSHWIWNAYQNTLGDLTYTAKISCSSQKLGLTFSFF